MFYTVFNEQKKEWSGLGLESPYDVNTSLATAILNSLRVNESKVAQICASTNMVMTYEHLRTLTIRAAKNLQSFNPKPKDVIVFITKDNFQVTPLVFASLCLGLTVAPIGTIWSTTEYMYLLEQTNPTFIVCDPNFYDVMRKCVLKIGIDAEIFTFGQQVGDSNRAEDLFCSIDDESMFLPIEVEAKTTLAFILRTSGTTNMPKAVCLSHATILNQMSRVSTIFKSTDIVLGFMPLAGISGLRLLIAGTLNGCTRIVLNAGQFLPERFFNVVETYGVTVVQCNVDSTEQLLNHPDIVDTNLSTIKRYLCVASKSPYKLIRQMNKFLNNGRFIHAYASTETSGLIAVNLNETSSNTVGRLISGCRVKVTDEVGNRLGIDEFGEICVKIKYPFSGYLDEPETTEAAFDDEGFYKTGDIGYFNEAGELYIAGRSFECFGYTILPSELEEFINEIDGVRQCCVVGIPNPDAGCLVAAVVVKTANSNCTKEYIFDAIADEFEYYKHLHGGVYFVDSIPLTTASKVNGKQIIEYVKKQNNQVQFNIY